MKHKRIILTPYDVQVKDDRVIFTGRRGKNPDFNQEFYEIHIMLHRDYWFTLIAKRLKAKLKSKIESIQKLIKEI